MHLEKVASCRRYVAKSIAPWTLQCSVPLHSTRFLRRIRVCICTSVSSRNRPYVNPFVQAGLSVWMPGARLGPRGAALSVVVFVVVVVEFDHRFLADQLFEDCPSVRDATHEPAEGAHLVPASGVRHLLDGGV